MKYMQLLSVLGLILFPVVAYSADLESLAVKLGTQIESQELKIAVMDFSSNSESKTQDSAIIRERLTTFLVKGNKGTIIERALLEKVLQEQKIQASGVISEATVKRIGELLGADAIITGTITELISDEVEVNARAIRVDNGKILAAGQATIKKDWKDFKPLNKTESGKASLDSAQYYYQRGAKYLNEGKYSIATEFYAKAIGKQPDYLEAYFDRGVAWFFKGNYDEAVLDFTKILDLDLENIHAYLYRGDAYARKKDYIKAIDDYSKAIELQPKPLVSILITRGMVYQDAGRLDEAIEDYSEAIRLAPASPSIFIKRGIAYYKKADYDSAIADYDKALNLSTKNSYIYRARGGAYFLKGEYQKAITDFSKAIEYAPGYPGSYLGRALAYSSSKNYPSALLDLDKTIKLNPYYTEAYVHRGDIHSLKGENDKAISDYTRATELNPADSTTYYSRALAYKRKGEAIFFEGFQKTQKEANAKGTPITDDDAYNRNKYLGAASYDKAIEDLSLAIKLDPGFAEAYYERGLIYDDKEDSNSAFENYTKALEINPELNGAIYYRRGIIFGNNGEHEKAVSDFSKAIAFNPKDFMLYKERARAYRLIGDEQKAVSDEKKYNDLLKGTD